MKIERKVAETITQQPIEVTINGRVFQAPRPSVGTLIMMSAEIANLPTLELTNGDPAGIMTEVLLKAKDCEALARILAISLMGARTIKENEKRRVECKKMPFLRIFRKCEDLDQLTEWIACNASPAEVTNAITQIIQTMEVGDFFACTTFLGGLNLTAPKKVS